MSIFDYIFHRDSSQQKNPNKLSSYRQAAELICLCWNKLDMSFLEPYLDDNVVWKGGVPHKVLHGKKDYLELMRKVFDSLSFSKRSYRADVDGSDESAVAIVSVDGEEQDLMHRLKLRTDSSKRLM